MLLARAEHGRLTAATPDATATCPACGQPVRAKCGPIKIWHWAHHATDCDPWAEPETRWHFVWKLTLATDKRADLEIVRTHHGITHRADAVLPSGTVVELQHGYLPFGDISAREEFWTATNGKVIFIYDTTRFTDRIHWGRRGGFWWKHGAKSMVLHHAPVWWHAGDELLRVALALVPNEDGTERVIGRVVERLRIRFHFPSLYSHIEVGQ